MSWRKVATRLAVLAGAAALSIPLISNQLNAVERWRQKRTMGDLRTIATAIESYSIDATFYPLAETMEQLAALTEPTYIKELPLTDGWGQPFEYWVLGRDHYILRSSGGDREFRHVDPRAYPGGRIDER